MTLFFYNVIACNYYNVNFLFYIEDVVLLSQFSHLIIRHLLRQTKILLYVYANTSLNIMDLSISAKVHFN